MDYATAARHLGTGAHLGNGIGTATTANVNHIALTPMNGASSSAGGNRSGTPSLLGRSLPRAPSSATVAVGPMQMSPSPLLGPQPYKDSSNGYANNNLVSPSGATSANGASGTQGSGGSGGGRRASTVVTNDPVGPGPEPPSMDIRGPFKVLADVRHLWALGFVTVLGGHYLGWNPGLATGIGTFSIACALISFAYFALVMCLAEMASCLQVPFAGGSFFFARATMGRGPGFLVGCAEALEYIAYVSTTVLVFGEMITETFGTDVRLEPLWWFLFYLTALPVHLYGQKFFWEFNWWFGVAILLIHFLYVFGTTPQWDTANLYLPPSTSTATASTEDRLFAGGFQQFMVILALPVWFFIGVETITLGCEEAHNHKISVGKGLITCMTTLFICMIGTVMASSLSGPNLESVAGAAFPFNQGFSQLVHSSYEIATVWSFPATYGTCFGFIYAYGRQVCSMARSGILPPVLARTFKEKGTPSVSTIGCSVVAFILTGFGWLVFDVDQYESILFALYQLGALCTYLVQLVAYLILWYKYRSVPRAWSNPLGPTSAVLGILIFALTLVSVVGFQPYPWQPVMLLICWFIPLVCYYWRYARHRRSASPEEICALFILHTVKINRLRVMKVKQQAQRPHYTQLSSRPTTFTTHTVNTHTRATRVPTSGLEHQPLAHGNNSSDQVGEGDGQSPVASPVEIGSFQNRFGRKNDSSATTALVGRTATLPPYRPFPDSPPSTVTTIATGTLRSFPPNNSAGSPLPHRGVLHHITSPKPSPPLSMMSPPTSPMPSVSPPVTMTHLALTAASAAPASISSTSALRGTASLTTTSSFSGGGGVNVPSSLIAGVTLPAQTGLGGGSRRTTLRAPS